MNSSHIISCHYRGTMYRRLNNDSPILPHAQYNQSRMGTKSVNENLQHFTVTSDINLTAHRMRTLRRLSSLKHSLHASKIRHAAATQCHCERATKGCRSASLAVARFAGSNSSMGSKKPATSSAMSGAKLNRSINTMFKGNSLR